MTDSFDTIEAYLKQANFKLDKVLFELDSHLDKSANNMQIPLNERCSSDNINKIQQQVEQLRNRYQNLQAQREEINKVFSERLESLEKKVANLPS